MNYQSEAICIFGSVARDSQDSRSDKDILVVSNSKNKSIKTISKLEADGWSVAYYTWNRLQKMSSMGSLFIQHLKQDGQILEDSSSDLFKLLYEFRPKKNYNSEILKSIQLARSADRDIKSLWQSQFQCDVLYTFIRNAGILELASYSIYEFDYFKIIEKIAEIKKLDLKEKEYLMQLRSIKSEYRSRVKPKLDCLSIALNTKHIADKYFNLQIQKIDITANARLFDLSYATLRDIEGRLLAYEAPKVLDSYASHKNVRDIWDYILNPRNYSWNIRTLDKTKLLKINEVISNFNNIKSKRISSSADRNEKQLSHLT